MAFSMPLPNESSRSGIGKGIRKEESSPPSHCQRTIDSGRDGYPEKTVFFMLSFSLSRPEAGKLVPLESPQDGQ